MTRTLITPAVAAAALASQASMAQTHSTTSLAPAGPGPGVYISSPDARGHSALSRASVKAQTRADRSAGSLQAAGEAM